MSCFERSLSLCLSMYVCHLCVYFHYIHSYLLKPSSCRQCRLMFWRWLLVNIVTFFVYFVLFHSLCLSISISFTSFESFELQSFFSIFSIHQLNICLMHVFTMFLVPLLICYVVVVFFEHFLLKNNTENKRN